MDQSPSQSFSLATESTTGMHVPVSLDSVAPITTAPAADSTTFAVAIPNTQVSDDNTALIGGVVGGGVALLLIVALIVVLVVRNRQRNTAENSQPQPTSQGAVVASSSNYDKGALYSASFLNAPPNDYDIGAIGKQYDAVEPLSDTMILASNNATGVTDVSSVRTE